MKERYGDMAAAYLALYPTAADLPSWPAFDAARPQTMEVGERFAPLPVAPPPNLAFFERFLNK